MHSPSTFVLPPLADLEERAEVVALPMRVPFRGVTTREALLIDAPSQWAEFAPFPEYEPAEASCGCARQSTLAMAVAISVAAQIFPNAGCP